MKTITTHVLGYPRIGARRELKTALEAYWRGAIDDAALHRCASLLRQRHWALQADAGLDLVTVGDFALYDQVANHVQLFGCEPARFGFTPQTDALTRYFTMARGVGGQHAQEKNQAPTQEHAPGHTDEQAQHASCCGSRRTHALDMTKWFDTNYHYLVPEFDAATTFTLAADALLAQVAEARALGHRVKAALIGPLTFLWLGKEHGIDRLSLLPRLLPLYTSLLAQLKAAGAAWVQMDEPILGLDLPGDWRHAFEPVYCELNGAGAQLLLATYFSPLEENLSLACRLPVAGLHVDGVRAAHELTSVCDWLALPKVLSVGIVDGRNVWRTDTGAALARLSPLLERRAGQLWLAPSCSLLHVPFSLEGEDKLSPALRARMAFASEKLAELGTLKAALLDGARPPARQAAATPALSTQSPPQGADQRQSPFAVRRAIQQRRFALPAFPTTTIGSFPQTAAIRAARAAHRKGAISSADYDAAMQAEIAYAVAAQEQLGLDVLVHGEAERNDMVEYFGEQLDGYAFTANGWVQSYGSRCVKPPVIHADVARKGPMTVRWSAHAQSLTAQPVKGMLTGPITMLQWSFVRQDQPRSETALQIALAIRAEVADLEAAGIGIIQIDEPALREGLPLRRAQWDAYLDWATRAFRIAASGAADETQIHTHMCYAEFNDILPSIAALDADVITIETSRSDMALLDGFGKFSYPNGIGPGVYDIHSPQVPTTGDIERLLRKAALVIPAAHLWVNPDCGLKTRGWEETREALANMVAAAKRMRGQADAGEAPAAGAGETAPAPQLT